MVYLGSLDRLLRSRGLTGGKKNDAPKALKMDH